MSHLSKSFWVFVLVLIGLPVFSQIEIKLRKSFIDSFKRRATIETNFLIAKSHERANPPSKDGDLHFAGTSKIIGLPVVAEIMNAKVERNALDLIHSKEGGTDSVLLRGAWRIWCEHAGESFQHQGGRFPRITGTNPDHVFEIHPVTQIDNINMNRSLKHISGFKYKVPEDAFYRYSNARCKIIPEDDYITIETNGVGYNYVDFWIELLDEDQDVLEDGRFVYCKVLGLDREIISQKMRMVFIKGTPPETVVKNLSAGEQLHVIGIPRLNLSLVDWRVRNSDNNPDVLEWNLPVEMIIVTTYRR